MEPHEYAQVRELYHELADRPLDEAVRTLRQRPVPAAVRREVEELLGHESRVEAFDDERMGEVAFRLVDGVGVDAGGDDDGEREALPERIAGFRIVEVLGRGGMGVVYRGVQERPKREVAVKVLPPFALGPGSLRRFEYEAEILARLDHPYVAKVIQAGVDEGSGGIPYIAMELVRGDDLVTHCEERALGLAERLELFRRVCEGVEHAHQHGVVHRDLKPANVLVSADGRPRILDFGLARPAAGDERSTPGRTEAGAVLGSIAWMSPEQARGAVDRLDVRSDVYSLGVVLYRLLTGAMPHDLAGLMPWEAARRICEEEPQRLARLRPELAGDVEAIVARALEKEPERRYPGAGDLGRDVQRFLDHLPVEARPWSATYQFTKFARRHRLLVGAAALLVLAIAAGLVSSLVLWREAEDARVLASAETQRALENEARAERERAYLLRLSDLRRVRDLTSEADRYWPVHSDLVPALEGWLNRATGVAANLPEHEAFLVDLTEGRGPVVEGLTEAERGWWIGALGALLVEMRALSGDGGTIASVRARLESSRTIRARTIDDARFAWEDAVDYAADPDGPYAGLELTPQLGLVPLGPNPVSELLEFWHVESGAEPPWDPETGACLPMDTDGIVLVLVPGGTFLMGSQSFDPNSPNFDVRTVFDESPPHPVTLSPFFLSRFEMSQGQWERIMGGRPSFFGPDNPGDDTWPRAHPVERVSWSEATEACRRAGLVLPTEAQWEYAARAGTSTPWWCGADPECLALCANLGDQYAAQAPAPPTWTIEPWTDGYYTPAPLGAMAPNPFGFHDMLGNVREWIRDHYFEQLYRRGPVTDPLVTESDRGELERCVRGADYGSGAAEARASQRSAASAEDYEISFVGLRPGRELE